MRGIIYRLGVRLRELGERLCLRRLVVLGLALKEAASR
jgi:hypothetical protein